MIAISDRGCVRLLSMAHGKVNALDCELLAALDSALSDALRASAEAIVLTGNGRLFSAGVDLVRVLDGGGEYLDTFLPALSDIVERLFAFSKPVVVAIDGHAIGGGCVLACAGDLRIAAAGDALIGLPELRVGVPLPPAVLEAMRYAVGDHRLPRLVLGGATVSLDEAPALGLVDRTVPAEHLIDTAVDEAARLAALGSSFAISKSLLRRTARARIEAERRESDAEVLAIWKRPGTLAAIRSYLDRTIRR